MFLPGLCWIEPTFDFLLKNPRICPTQQNVNLRQNKSLHLQHFWFELIFIFQLLKGQHCTEIVLALLTQPCRV